MITARQCRDCKHLRKEKDGWHCYRDMGEETGKKISWNVDEGACAWWYPK